MIFRRAACLSFLFAALLAAGPASANLKLCNRTSYILYAATAQRAKQTVTTKGWLRIVPGACANAIAAPLASPPYYVYAQSSRAHSGPSRAWGGSEKFCVRHGNFTRTAPLLDRCTGDDFAVGFSRIASERKRDFTQSFTDKEDFATLSAARSAGLKRLLTDNGYKFRANDEKRFETALANFRRKTRLSADASDEKLFQALEDAASRVAAPAGYSVCNTTASAVWAAIGEKDGKNWVSRGWWKIPPANCATAISQPLKTDKIFVLADVPGKRPLVTGPAKFCVTDIAFEIQGRGKCKERGMREAGFAETAVKGREGYVARIGPKGLLLMPPRRNN